MNSTDRKHLKSLAHHLKPVAQVGKAGVTDGLIQSVDDALRTGELIKIRFLDMKDEKDQVSNEIARRTRSERVGTIGHIAILYREQPDPEKRKIVLPTGKARGQRIQNPGARIQKKNSGL
jgi:RNA-binding protein